MECGILYYNEKGRGEETEAMKHTKILPLVGYAAILALLFASAWLLFASRNLDNAGRRQKKIGAVYMTMNNPFFEVVNEEIAAAIENKGDVLITRYSAMDADTQEEQIEDFIGEGVDCILVNAVDWKRVGDAIAQARAADIPVIAVDTPVYDSDLLNGMVVSDNSRAGALCAKDLIKRRKKAARILFLIQSENKSACDRIAGFKETLEEAGFSYEVAGELECKGQLEVAQPLVEAMLGETKDIDAVVALNDPSALGAMAALDAEEMLSDVLVYGVDGAPEAKSMIKEGRMTATAAQSPETMGKETVSLLYKILDGEETGRRIVLPVSLITEKNVDTYGITGWQ